MKKLEHLDVRENPFLDLPIKQMANSSIMKTLTKLEMDSEQIEDLLPPLSPYPNHIQIDADNSVTDSLKMPLQTKEIVNLIKNKVRDVQSNRNMKLVFVGMSDKK